MGSCCNKNLECGRSFGNRKGAGARKTLRRVPGLKETVSKNLMAYQDSASEDVRESMKNVIGCWRKGGPSYIGVQARSIQGK